MTPLRHCCWSARCSSLGGVAIGVTAILQEQDNDAGSTTGCNWLPRRTCGQSARGTWGARQPVGPYRRCG